MERLCSRQDFLGRVSRHYLSASPVSEKRWRSPARRHMRDTVQQPRLSLRALASYRTLLTLLLLYMLFALFSFGLLSSTALILIISLLYELLLLLLADKLKTHWLISVGLLFIIILTLMRCLILIETYDLCDIEHHDFQWLRCFLGSSMLMWLTCNRSWVHFGVQIIQW